MHSFINRFTPVIHTYIHFPEINEKYSSLPFGCLLGIIMKKYTFYARTKTSFHHNPQESHVLFLGDIFIIFILISFSFYRDCLLLLPNPVFFWIFSGLFIHYHFLLLHTFSQLNAWTTSLTTDRQILGEIQLTV